MNERSIFAAAMDIADPAERAAYLDQACEEDTSLRQHLEGPLPSRSSSEVFCRSRSSLPRPLAGRSRTSGSP